MQRIQKFLMALRRPQVTTLIVGDIVLINKTAYSVHPDQLKRIPIKN